MGKKIAISAIIILIFVLSITFLNINDNQQENLQTNEISGTIVAKTNNKITIQDENSALYTFENKEIKVNIGENVILKYTGIIDKNVELQNNEVIDITVSNDYEAVLNENDIFGAFYEQAKNKLQSLNLEEKISQIILARYPDNAIEVLNKYKLSGFVFYEKDFANKTESEVINMIKNLQNASTIPLLTAVDEEGGKIVRISSNPNLVETKFKSSNKLYNEGGFSLIRQDTITKSFVLNKLGLNLNLAPVVDVATDIDAYMYERTLKLDTSLTEKYAETVILASKNTGVSYTLKHFPGYGNNTDTHIAKSIDTRTFSDIMNNDIPPFKKGIDAGAEAVLVGHNIVTSLDSTNPSSVSINIHNILRNELNFSGVVITDDLDMGSLTSETDKYKRALLSGNDLLIVTNYENAINEIKDGVINQTLSESLIDNAAIRVLAWKYYKGLINDNEK